jgi:hypothetical protein
METAKTINKVKILNFIFIIIIFLQNYEGVPVFHLLMVNNHIIIIKMTYTKDRIVQSISYECYRNLIDNLLEVDKTTGLNHSAAMIHYTKMNVQRMKRLDKTTQLNSELVDAISRIKETYTWLIITEAWCGDAAQIIPIIKKMAEASAGKIVLKFILRDEHLDIMDAHLTNGTRAIPKTMILDDHLNEITNWGPRPKTLQTMVMDWMKDPELTHEDWSEKVHSWYAKDKTQEIQREFINLLRTLS